MDQLRKDFEQFQTLHSWYKHIPLEGLDFFVFQVADEMGAHWYFSIDKPECIDTVYTVRFGPFLRGVEGNGCGSEYVSGAWAICELAGDKFDIWMKTHYPDFEHVKWTYKDMNNPIVISVFRAEIAKYWCDLRLAVGI